MPWPEWPKILRTSHSHEEGVNRDWSVLTVAFSGEDGWVRRLNAVRLEWEDGDHFVMKEVPDSGLTLDCELVLIAAGFIGPETDNVIAELGVELDAQDKVAAGIDYMTSLPGVFVAGDARRGQSLVVWAIWEGREAARAIHQYLMGRSGWLPAGGKDR
jgi:glutamate synthase (NADPH/NADH) small chain